MIRAAGIAFVDILRRLLDPDAPPGGRWYPDKLTGRTGAREDGQFFEIPEQVQPLWLP